MSTRGSLFLSSFLTVSIVDQVILTAALQSCRPFWASRGKESDYVWSVGCGIACGCLHTVSHYPAAGSNPCPKSLGCRCCQKKGGTVGEDPMVAWSHVDLLRQHRSKRRLVSDFKSYILFCFRVPVHIFVLCLPQFNGPMQRHLHDRGCPHGVGL